MKKYHTIGTKLFHSLNPGDIFKAVIHDIRPGEVTIQLEGGKLFTARSLVLPEARIGEYSVFEVRENDGEGRIILSMVRSDAEELKAEYVAELLKSLGLTRAPEVQTATAALVQYGLPVNPENISIMCRVLFSPLLYTAEAEKLLKSLNKGRRSYTQIKKDPTQTQAELHHDRVSGTVILVSKFGAERVELLLTKSPSGKYIGKFLNEKYSPFTILSNFPGVAIQTPTRFKLDMRI